MNAHDRDQAWAVRVRRMAERMLQDLAPEDPNLVWVRRMSGVRERRELATEQATRQKNAS